MLLDRRRINKWAKWVALALVIVFGIGFLALGVGSGSGINFSSLWGRSNTAATTPSGPQEAIKAFEATLATDPTNADALLGIANTYKTLGDPAREAQYLEQLAPLEAGGIEIYMRLARLYMSDDVANYNAAVQALRSATALDNNNAEAYLQLGIAERAAGNTTNAVLAWARYLALEPEGEMAETVREAIEQLKPTNTTTGDATTTSVSGGSTSTTTAGATSTTAP